ncbi:MAG TPA: hypothetical protein VFH49_05375, partial [Aquabacterium sp.]|nr:hypothetical protein [Aquabacterium sp.]
MGVAGDIRVEGAKVLYAADSTSRSLTFVTPTEGDVSFGLGVHADLMGGESPADATSFRINDIDYRVIENLADFPGIAGDGGMNGRYVLAADVDASSISGFTPVGSAGPQGEAFGGIFRGLGHTVSNLSIQGASATSRTGFFGATDGASISDLTLKNVSVSVGSEMGAIVGSAHDSQIDRVAAVGASVAGGLVTGGLVGVLDGGRLTQSYATGTVAGADGAQSAAGGLVGAMRFGAKVSESFSLANVSGTRAVGGLVGEMMGSSVKPSITDAYASGSVTGTTRVGGLVGSQGSGSITATYANGAVSGSTYVGGLVGWRPASGTTVSSSYWDTQTTGQTSSAGTGAIGRQSVFMKLNSGANRFNGFDFTSAAPEWLIYQGFTTPLLTAFLKPLTITSDNITKPYDGQSSALLNPVYSVAGADVSGHLFGLSTPYGTNKDANTTAVPHYSVTGIWSDQFGYAVTLKTGTLTITRRPVDWVVASKVYNGDAVATVTGVSGILAEDESKVRFGTAPTDNLSVSQALYHDGA